MGLRFYSIGCTPKQSFSYGNTWISTIVNVVKYIPTNLKNLIKPMKHQQIHLPESLPKTTRKLKNKNHLKSLKDATPLWRGGGWGGGGSKGYSISYLIIFFVIQRYRRSCTHSEARATMIETTGAHPNLRIQCMHMPTEYPTPQENFPTRCYSRVSRDRPTERCLLPRFS